MPDIVSQAGLVKRLRDRIASNDGPVADLYLFAQVLDALDSHSPTDSGAGPDGFTARDFIDTASQLRSGHEVIRRAALSNNYNVILAALDRASDAHPAPPQSGETLTENAVVAAAERLPLVERMKLLLDNENLTFAECGLAEEWSRTMRDALVALKTG